jgi:hypothetical protein
MPEVRQSGASRRAISPGVGGRAGAPVAIEFTTESVEGFGAA